MTKEQVANTCNVVSSFVLPCVIQYLQFGLKFPFCLLFFILAPVGYDLCKILKIVSSVFPRACDWYVCVHSFFRGSFELNVVSHLLCDVMLCWLWYSVLKILLFHRLVCFFQQL